MNNITVQCSDVHYTFLHCRDVYYITVHYTHMHNITVHCSDMHYSAAPRLVTGLDGICPNICSYSWSRPAVHITQIKVYT